MPRTTAPIKDPAPTPLTTQVQGDVPADPLAASFRQVQSSDEHWRKAVVLGLDPVLGSGEGLGPLSNLTRGPNWRLKPRMAYYVYILASRPRGTLYIGVTGDLVRRVWEHRSGAVPGFTRRYGVRRLVWFEVFDDASAAIQREKILKHWLRAWKIALIERANPTWRDLYDEIAADACGPSGQARGRQKFTCPRLLRADWAQAPPRA